MHKKNCWEVKKCGRQPGGDQIAHQGLCPASTLIAVNGINGGINGGRACWALTGTLSGPAEKVQGTFARILHISCYECDFYEQVLIEEQENFKGTVAIVQELKALITATATPSPSEE
ncbi:MAG: hypothetical protein D3916_10195 [Candidatus Electrothrix sp. MAN1_4]|nr:hypothetical protein [Candidatus Electrothrix sp. MAN1_4]